MLPAIRSPRRGTIGTCGMNVFVEDRSVLKRASALPHSTVSYGDEPEQIADVRIGQDGTSRPLAILIHGGFWRPQIDRAHSAPMCESIAAAGWTIAAMEYRRVPGSSHLTLQDVRSAIESLPSLIGEHNGNVLLVGHSAGGHLALWAAGTRVV